MMICPNCKITFQKGFMVCSICESDLINEYTYSENNNQQEPHGYGIVLTTFNSADISLIKAILTKEEISYFFKGEKNINHQKVVPATLMVRIDQIEKAENILRDLNAYYISYLV